jgi:DNA-binding HxlR family transcriptional regulator
VRPKVPPIACPVRASLGVLGRKWALLVLRDVAFYEGVRFSDILRNNPGMTPRILVFRLRELEEEGFLRKVRSGGPRGVVYELAPKGRDAIPILTAFTNFGFQHHAGEVFADGKARTLGQVLPGSQEALLRGLAAYAREAPPEGRRRTP